MEIKSISQDFENELFNLISLFKMPDDFVCIHSQTTGDGNIQNKFSLSCPTLSIEKQFTFSNNFDDSLPVIAQKSISKRIAKTNLYDALSSLTGKKLPWGSLTGIRPTKFARELVEQYGVKEHLLAETLEKDYRVSKDKARLVVNILKNQKCIIRNDNLIDLYINIPICPSRCLYCSFISSEIERVKDKVDLYIECLIKELDSVKKIIADKAYIVRNIYIGGGTPSVLSAKQLDWLLGSIGFSPSEFTVECGRPDTIDKEKLQVLKKHNVSRISINPQSFCDATLKRIGRKHKVQDVLKAYSDALVCGFVVNMDLIAGLPGEKLSTFKRSIKTLLELAPDNVTLHTLSVKQGSLLAQQQDATEDEQQVAKMVEYGQKVLLENGYKPYYMYRQKKQLGGLENVGFFRDNICVFNVDSMEETNTVIAVGANALSKRVYNLEGRIERQANVKFVEDYILRIDEMIQRKRELFK